MKVRELIRRLMEADPTGEEEACVGSVDIHFVAREPAYHDGKLQVLRRDPARTGRCYDICGAEFRQTGQKVSIYTLSVEDALWEDPDLPVEGSHHMLAEWRRQARGR